jgi:hypothetical protein
MAMMIGPTLGTLEINVSFTDQVDSWVVLDKWKGYPSPHFKLEFIQLIQWLDNFDFQSFDPTDSVKINRVARIVLAVALILENCYYTSETPLSPPSPDSIRGKCKAYINDDITPLNYDARIFLNWKAANPG